MYLIISLIFDHVYGYNISNTFDILHIRENIMQKIHNSHIKKCHYFPKHSRDDFANGKWDYLSSQPYISKLEQRSAVYVYNPCMSTYNLGNSIGNYFNEIFCAIESNTNLIIGTKVWDYPHMPFEYKGKSSNHNQKQYLNDLEKHQISFFDMFPSIIEVDIINQNRLLTLPINDHIIEFLFDKSLNNNEIFQINNLTLNENHLNIQINSIKNSNNNKYEFKKQQTIKNFDEKCKCEKYCWSDKLSIWIKYYNIIKIIIIKSLNYHTIKTTLISNNNNNTILINISDKSNHNNELALAFIPDVAIHYRCGDNIPSNIYGLLSFHTITNIITHNSNTTNIKYIYILADPPYRAGILGSTNFVMHCTKILETLYEKIIHTFPNTIVILKRSGDPILDLARLAYAKITICSVSTFCLWPAIANNNKVYFPLTSLVSGMNTNDLMNIKNDNDIIISKNIIVSNNINDYYFGKSFYWIKKPLIITKFKADSTIEEVMEVLNQ